MTKETIIYHVEHPMTSGGPTFTSKSEALRYVSHCLGNENESMRIWIERVKK